MHINNFKLMRIYLPTFFCIPLLLIFCYCNKGDNKHSAVKTFNLSDSLALFIPSSNLPLIIIDSKGNITDSLKLDSINFNKSVKDKLDTIKVKAKMGIINNVNGKPNTLTDFCEFYKIDIGLRGNFSLAYPQKSYNISLREDKTKVSLLDLPQESKWVLQGPFADKTLIRNALIYKLFEKMGHYAPRTRFCELIVDGIYRGIYLLTEKIERDINKINISSLTMNDTLNNQLSGGYIIKIDRDRKEHWKSPYPFSGNKPTVYDIVYPSPKEVLCEQKEYIKNYITLFEEELHYLRFINRESNYQNMIDINSFVDFLIINEFAKNYDGYRFSTYMYKDGNNGKLMMGPVWDYDFSLGISVMDYDFSPQGWIYKNNKYVPFWWESLMLDSVFRNHLEERWGECRKNLLSNEYIFHCIDSLTQQIGEANVRHFKVWPIQKKWPNKTVKPTYEGNIDYLKKWITDRLVWLDENWCLEDKDMEAKITEKINDIRANKKWQEAIKKKAEDHQISIEDQIVLDAIWMAKQDKKANNSK